jgi:PKD repeat protein
MINQKGLYLKAMSMAIAFTSLALTPYKGTAQLTADFAYTPNLICSIPVVVNFQDQSLGNPVKWTWDFGDGNSSSAENPLKVYLTAGMYNVQLIIEDASHNKDTVTKSIQVNYLKADFSSIPNAMTCASNAIVTLNLVNASKGNGNINYTWDINENGSHTTINDAPFYKLFNGDDPSKYLIAKLTATNDFGCVATKTDTIGMGNAINIVKDSAASIQMANEECTTSDGWTYYSYHDAINPSRSILLMAIKKNGNDIGTIGDGTFQLMVSSTEGAGSNIAVLLTNPLITNQSGYWAMNRYWQVHATHQPTTPVGVRFYFNTQDLNDLNSSYATHDLTYRNLILYKTYGGNPDPTSNLDGASSITSLLNGNSADTINWVYTNLHGQKHLAEFQVNEFSGGGGAGGTVTTRCCLCNCFPSPEAKRAAMLFS